MHNIQKQFASNSRTPLVTIPTCPTFACIVHILACTLQITFAKSFFACHKSSFAKKLTPDGVSFENQFFKAKHFAQMAVLNFTLSLCK